MLPAFRFISHAPDTTHSHKLIANGYYPGSFAQGKTGLQLRSCIQWHLFSLESTAWWSAWL